MHRGTSLTLCTPFSSLLSFIAITRINAVEPLLVKITFEDPEAEHTVSGAQLIYLAQTGNEQKAGD